jgi:predicted outer membrane repeat protein
MWFSSWLGKRRRCTLNGRRYASSRQGPTYRPRLEALEDRWLPSQIGLSVTSLADAGPGTLRAAIQAADAGSPSDKFTIGFAVTGTIDLQSPLPDLNNSIAIQGPGANNLTVERAAGASFSSAIVTVDEGQSASLSGLTIANGNEGGIVNEGTLTVANCTVMNNSGSLHGNLSDLPMGGGVYNDYTGMLTVTNSTLSGNSALDGGGIFSLGTLTVGGTVVSGNSAVPFFEAASGVTFHAFGGGIYSADTLTMTRSTISGNTAEQNGGGIVIAFNGTVTSTISNSAVTDNSAGFEGGGIYSDGLLAVGSTVLSQNTANGIGGGIASDYSLTVSLSTFTGNSACEGGGIYNAGATTVRDSVFGGSSTDLSNSAELGGAIYNAVFGTLDVRGSTFSGNTASDSGGGIYNLGTATVQECTLSGNTAANDGGGIYNGASGTLTIDDSTVCDNFASLGADLDNLGVATINDSDVCVIGP